MSCARIARLYKSLPLSVTFAVAMEKGLEYFSVNLIKLRSKRDLRLGARVSTPSLCAGTSSRPYFNVLKRVLKFCK